jgi:hypothetical protein
LGAGEDGHDRLMRKVTETRAAFIDVDSMRTVRGGGRRRKLLGLYIRIAPWEPSRSAVPRRMSLRRGLSGDPMPYSSHG